jgi:hypothetical protein
MSWPTYVDIKMPTPLLRHCQTLADLLRGLATKYGRVFRQREQNLLRINTLRQG